MFRDLGIGVKTLLLKVKASYGGSLL